MSAMSDSVLFAVGTMLSSSVVMTFCCVTFVTSTSGDWPDTVSVSDSSPTLSSAFTVAVKFDVSCRPSLTSVAKPDSVNVTV